MALLALYAKVDWFLQLSPNAARGWLVARSVLTVGWLPISVAPFVVRRDLFPRGLSSKDSHVWLCCMHRAESLSAPCSQSSRCLLWWWFWRPIRRHSLQPLMLHHIYYSDRCYYAIYIKETEFWANWYPSRGAFSIAIWPQYNLSYHLTRIKGTESTEQPVS